MPLRNEEIRSAVHSVGAVIAETAETYIVISYDKEHQEAQDKVYGLKEHGSMEAFVKK